MTRKETIEKIKKMTYKDDFMVFVKTLNLSRDDYKAMMEYIDELSAVQPDHIADISKKVEGDCISRQAAIDAARDWYEGLICGSFKGLEKRLRALPPAQPETANIIVGKSRDGMTMWYQCDNCNEPVDENDLYCRGCGRRFERGSN